MVPWALKCYGPTTGHNHCCHIPTPQKQSFHLPHSQASSALLPSLLLPVSLASQWEVRTVPWGRHPFLRSSPTPYNLIARSNQNWITVCRSAQDMHWCACFSIVTTLNENEAMHWASVFQTVFSRDYGKVHLSFKKKGPIQSVSRNNWFGLFLMQRFRNLIEIQDSDIWPNGNCSVCESLFTTPWTIDPQVICPWDFPGKITGVGCHSFLQGFFLTQGLNLGLPHCRQILYCLSYQESPTVGNWKTLGSKMPPSLALTEWGHLLMPLLSIYYLILPSTNWLLHAYS